MGGSGGGGRWGRLGGGAWCSYSACLCVRVRVHLCCVLVSAVCLPMTACYLQPAYLLLPVVACLPATASCCLPTCYCLLLPPPIIVCLLQPACCLPPPPPRGACPRQTDARPPARLPPPPPYRCLSPASYSSCPPRRPCSPARWCPSWMLHPALTTCATACTWTWGGRSTCSGRSARRRRWHGL